MQASWARGGAILLLSHRPFILRLCGHTQSETDEADESDDGYSKARITRESEISLYKPQINRSHGVENSLGCV